MRIAPIVIGLAVAGAGVAGFLKSRNRVDTHEADAKLKAWAESTVAPVEDVDCPKAKLTKGNTFDCKVAFTAGTSATIHVVVTDDHGMVAYSWTPPIAAADKLATDIASAIKTQQGKDVAVDCGKGILEIPVAGLVCTAATGADRGHLRVKYDTNVKQIVWAAEP